MLQEDKVARFEARSGGAELTYDLPTYGGHKETQEICFCCLDAKLESWQAELQANKLRNNSAKKLQQKVN